jgi:phosphate transport system permease protein
VTQLIDRPPAPAMPGLPAAAPPGIEPPAPRKTPSPIRPRNFNLSDVALMAVCGLSSFALVWVLFYQLTLLSGAFGFLLCWYLAFLALYWLVVSKLTESQAATDRVVTVVMCTGAAIVIGAVIFIIVYVAAKAIPTIHWGSIFTKTQKGFEPAEPNALAHVGVLHAIVGTLEQVGIAAVIGVPIAVASAVLLNEVRGRGTRFIRTVITAMSGLPSIVAGLFIYSMLIINHVLSYSGFAASLALFVMLLPSVTRTTEEVLRVVPSGLREASLALGAPEWRTVWSVVLPTARSGVVTAVLLGIARIVGETAPLLFTAFGSQLLNANPFGHPQEALPLMVWTNVRQAQSVLIDLAYQAAFVLMAIVLVLFVSARVAGRTKSKTNKRKGRSTAPGGGRPFPANPTGTLEQPVPAMAPLPTLQATDPTLEAVLGHSSETQ